MKNTILSRRQTATTILTSIFTRKLPFPLALAALLALQSNLRAGVQYFDPDATPAGNDCTTGAGLGCTTTVGMPWDTSSILWTPVGNCGGATTTWTDGNDAVFWGLPGAGQVYTLTLDAPHTVSNLYFYATMSGSTITPNYTISGGGGNNTLTLVTGNVTVDGGLSPAGGSAGNLAEHLALPISGTHGLTKLGGGMLYLDKVNTFTGPITVSGLPQPATGGAIYATVANALPPNSTGIYITNAGVINISPNMPQVTAGPVVMVNGYITGTGGLTAPSYEVQNCRDGWNAINCPLKDTGVPPYSTFLKTTPATVCVSSANSFAGGATISAGLLTWRNNSALGTGTVTLNDANTGTNDVGLCRDKSAQTANLDLGNNIVVANLGTGNTVIGNLNATTTVRYNGTVTLNRSVILTAPTGGSVKFTQPISGPGGFTVGGPIYIGGPPTSTQYWANYAPGGGTVILGAANVHTGGSIVSLGTLEAQVDGSLGRGDVSVASGATLQLDTAAGMASSANLLLSDASSSMLLNFSGTSTINALSLDGGVTFANSGTWGAVGSTAVNQDGRFTESGVLQVTKSGSTTTLASSLSPADYGSSVTFTATVAVASGTPTGKVTFNDGATVLGTGNLSAGLATLTTNNLSVTGSPHSITAVYGGDASFVPSTSDALSQVINPNCSQTNAVLAIANNLNGTFKLTLVGTPGAYYYMVTQTNATQPMANWAVVAGSTNVATAPSGVWYFTATNAAPRYYRVAAVTVCP